MSNPNQLTTIESHVLAAVTGGARSSSTNLQLQQQLTGVTDALSTLKNQNTNNNSSFTKMLPMMMMMKFMRR